MKCIFALGFYTGRFNMCHYVEFSQIGSKMRLNTYVYVTLITFLDVKVLQM